ncbi:MAG: nucleoside hydrolase [Naasia sp.]
MDVVSPLPIRLLLDTDIGTDIDDELALAMIWGSPELDLIGVSASYGDTALRTRITRRMADLVGRRVHVAPGDVETHSGREIWWAGHEGDAYLPFDDDGVAPVDITEGGVSAGARLLAELGATSPASHLLAIGPLSTVASAFELEPELPARLAGLWIMGGDFDAGCAPEHNIVSDAVAARRVIGSDAPITLVPVDITRRVRLHEADMARFERIGVLGGLLAVQARAWMRRWDEDFELPHDPLTLLALLEPHHFTFSGPGRITVSDGTDGVPEGTTTFAPGDGPHRIVVDVDVEAASRAISDRVAAGLVPLPGR